MKKLVKTIIFMIIIILLSYSCSYGAVLQIKNTDSAVVTNRTISDFYMMAEGLKDDGQGLEGTSVDVKMANNYEWALVSYFGNSAYGIGKAQNWGSINGNITGVYNWGQMDTYTAGIIKSYASKTLTTAGNLTSDPSKNIILENAGTNKIDKFDKSSAYLEAAASVNNSPQIGDNANYPYSVRYSFFGVNGGLNANHSVYATGEAHPSVTFRPVIWN